MWYCLEPQYFYFDLDKLYTNIFFIEMFFETTETDLISMFRYTLKN